MLGLHGRPGGTFGARGGPQRRRAIRCFRPARAAMPRRRAARSLERQPRASTLYTG